MNPYTLHYTWMRYTFHEFMAICRYMYIHFVNLIVTQQSGETPLHHAVTSGNADLVYALPHKTGFKVDVTYKVNMLRKYEIVACIKP